MSQLRGITDMRLLISSIIVLCLARVALAVKHGVIGYGITMYKPLCCYACHDSLSSLYLNCTTFSTDSGDDNMSMKLRKRMDMMSMGSTSDACYASSKPWLQTLAYCVTTQCKADAVAQRKQEKCFQDLSMSATSLTDALPARLPTSELPKDAEWLNYTMLVNGDLYHANYLTLQEFEYSEDSNTRYATVLLATVVGICVLSGLYRLKKSMLPKGTLWPPFVTKPFHSYIALPALFGKRHLQPLPYNLGYVPSRVLSMFIGAYIILNIIFCCVSYRNVWPNTWYSTAKYEMAAYVSNRTGVLSFANLALAIMLAGRNNLLIAITGWSQTTFLTFHRWASRIATLQAVIHSIIYTATYFWSPGGSAAVYDTEAAKPYYWWGIIATTALCLAIVFAVLPIRLRYYETFLVTHIVLVVLALVACWYHVDIRFSKKWGYEVWLYVAFAFWAADRLSRFTRLAWYNGRGLASATAEMLPGGRFVHITVYPKVIWSFGPGQHVFVYFSGLCKFWENHPFSVVSWSPGKSNSTTRTQDVGDTEFPAKPEKTMISETSEIEKGFQSATVKSESSALSASTSIPEAEPCVHFLLRITNGMTSSLVRHLVSNTATLTDVCLPIPPLSLSVAFEGPYGGHLSPALKYADTILYLAGGIGITNCLSYVQQYVSEQGLPSGKRHMMEASRVVLAWTAKEPELIAHVVDKMLSKDADGSLEVKLWYTGEKQGSGTNFPEMRYSRMNVNEVIAGVIEKGKKTVVVVCGPGSFADEARAAVVRQAKFGMEIDLVEEAFAW